VQAAAASTVGEALAATVERDTTAGHAFTVPQGFVLRAADGLLLLQVLEGDGGIALIEVQAGNVDEALARAMTTDLAVRGLDFTLEQRESRRALVLRDGLREFVFLSSAHPGH
jgi:hypothetical protein